MNGKGFVVNANTRAARINEILKWSGDPWLPFIAALNVQLGLLDPNYTIVQIKEKFGRLTFYYQTDVPGLRKKMDSLVAKSAREVEDFDETTRRLSRDTTPPNEPHKRVWR